MEPVLSPRYRIIERSTGHTPKRGKSAGEELNWAYRVEDTNTNTECIAMFCKPSHFTIIDMTTWLELKKDYTNITWYYAANGYISRTAQKGDTLPYTYLHQFVIKYSGHGKGQDSIDHIHGEPELEKRLDNRINNLRIVSQSVQNENRAKVSRHYNAKQLPTGITELPKFIVYYKECYNKEKNLTREFFTVEGHPKLKGKRQASSKSNKVNIQTKLQEVKDIITKLENNSVDAEAVQLAEPIGTTSKIIEIKNTIVSEPIQWKISNIYNALLSGNYASYLAYLQENNKQSDIKDKLDALVISIKSTTEEAGKTLIKTFIEGLRTIRHNALCYSKNNALLLREDRANWNSQSVLRAFNANMLTQFKEYTEAKTGESADDPIWSKRWTSFVESVLNETDTIKKKSFISNFIRAQRTKKFRKSKCSAQDS